MRHPFRIIPVLRVLETDAQVSQDIEYIPTCVILECYRDLGNQHVTFYDYLKLLLKISSSYMLWPLYQSNTEVNYTDKLKHYRFAHIPLRCDNDSKIDTTDPASCAVSHIRT